MIYINNVEHLDGKIGVLEVASADEMVIDGTGLIAIPALIDPHVHFRVPGLEHKETWHSAALAALKGGITTVFDMPNTLPACITKQRLDEKKKIIDIQLKEAHCPLRYHLYLGADKANFHEISAAQQDIIGLKVFMGSTTGDLVMDDDSSLHAAFSIASAHNLVVAVHAEDEALITERTASCRDLNPRAHSKIRNWEVAYRATEKAISLAKLYKTRLYLLHIGTSQELRLIAEAKREGVDVFAETTPHHLLLSEKDYENLGTKVQVNPPIRTEEDNEALFAAIKEGIIDTIGSDHAPHTLEEKNKPYGQAPSGIPGIELMLALLLNTNKIPLTTLVKLMRTNIEKIFHLKTNEDIVLIDREKIKCIQDCDLKTKCGWSPYAGLTLKGFPVITIMQGKIYDFR
ncbi:MAG: dihydroorotase [Chlamydiota bacterium]